MIVSGSTSQSLGAALATATGKALTPVSFRSFPDGERLAAAPGFSDDRAIVVAATTSPEAHLELLQLQDAVREAGATEVVTVIPYMGYARQDEPYSPRGEREPGYPVSARAVAQAVSTGADRVVLVSPHETSVADFFTVTTEIVSAASRLAEPLPADLDSPLFLAPDEGATDLADAVRDAYGPGETDHFEKTRYAGDDVDIAPSDADPAGRDVVVVDDIIATGSTMSEAVSLLTDKGATRVYASCVHPVLVGSARTKLARAGVEAVYGTDTIERAESAVSVAPVVANLL